MIIMKFPRKIASAFFLIVAFLLLLQFYLPHSESDVDKELPLKIENASATYEGFGFENAISTSPNSEYVAGQEGEDVSYVEFGVEKPSRVEGIYIKWYSTSCFARTVEITLFDEKNKEIGKVKDYEKERPLESIIKFNRVKGCKKIKLTFFDFTGEDRVLLRKIKVFEKLTQQTYEEYKIYLSALDERNPLSVGRLPITLKIKNISDALCKGIESDHDKIMSFMNYLNTFEYLAPSKPHFNTIVSEKAANCGDFAHLLAALCACQNIKARIITMNYFTKQNGHVVIEAFVDGKWRLYDPTYGGYYRLISNTSELPLSLKEILKIYKNEPESIEFTHTIRRNGFDVYTGKDIYLNSNPVGPIGLDKPMFYPLSLKTGAELDLSIFKTVIENQGSNIIGASSINTNHTWVLHGLSKGKKYEFIISPKSLQKENAEQNVFILKANYLEAGNLKFLEHEFKFENGKTAPWSIKFIADSEKIEIKLFHDYKGPDLLFMSIGSYELRETQ
jgi:hypothetical protein